LRAASQLGYLDLRNQLSMPSLFQDVAAELNVNSVMSLVYESGGKL